MNIQENNKILAEFVGDAIIDADGNHKDTNYRYHSDWNWLMAVVEKIESFEGVDILLKGSKFQIKVGGKTFTCNTISIKNSIYLACVEFAKWYNSNKTS